MAMSHLAPTLPIGTIWATASLTASSDASTPASLDNPATPPLSGPRKQCCSGYGALGQAAGGWKPAAEHYKCLVSSLTPALLLMLEERRVTFDCMSVQQIWGCQDQGLM